MSPTFFSRSGRSPDTRPGRYTSRRARSGLLGLLALFAMGSSSLASKGPDFLDDTSDPENTFTCVSFALSSGKADAGAGTARIGLGADGRELRLTGDLINGVADRIAASLTAHPGIERLRLSSDGGLVAEALAIAALVGARRLDTVVSEDCASACTLIFVRGHRRSLGPRGRLGFHGPYEVGFLQGTHTVDARSERNAYLRAGLEADFVARALTPGPDEMWYPDASRLRKVGAVTELGFDPAMIASTRKPRRRIAWRGGVATR